MECITCDFAYRGLLYFVVVRGSNDVLSVYIHSVSLQRMGLPLKTMYLYIYHRDVHDVPFLELKQLGIIILAIQNNHTNNIENVLTIKACVKEKFLFNVYIV